MLRTSDVQGSLVLIGDTQHCPALSSRCTEVPSATSHRHFAGCLDHKDSCPEAQAEIWSKGASTSASVHYSQWVGLVSNVEKLPIEVLIWLTHGGMSGRI